MKYVFMLLLAMGLFAPQASRAQEEPGNIIIAAVSALPEGPYFVCIPPTWPGGWSVVEVWARPPLQPVNRVRFQIAWPPDLSHDPGELAYSGSTDLSDPGDDIWDIQLPECHDSPDPYPSIPLVYYIIRGTLGTGWVCTYGDEVPRPIWTSCSGETFEAPLFDLGDDWEDGCFPYGILECAVATQDRSWGTLKASY